MNITDEPQIILLNGTSSVGKSSTAEALQHHFNNSFKDVTQDQAIKSIPYTYTQDAARIEIVNRVCNAAQSLAQAGESFIVDTVFGAGPFHALQQSLAGHCYFSVGLTAPMHVVEERERIRGDRTIGIARKQFDCHNGNTYNIMIDNEHKTPDEVAQIIITHLPSPINS